MQLPDAEQVTFTQSDHIASCRITWLDSRLTFTISLLTALDYVRTFPWWDVQSASSSSWSEPLWWCPCTSDRSPDVRREGQADPGLWFQKLESGQAQVKPILPPIQHIYPKLLSDTQRNETEAQRLITKNNTISIQPSSRSYLITSRHFFLFLFSSFRSPGELKNFISERGLALIRNHAMWLDSLSISCVKRAGHVMSLWLTSINVMISWVHGAFMMCQAAVTIQTRATSVDTV